jgi:UDP-N-acetylmuramoylalanine-D-glutamate ligase
MTLANNTCWKTIKKDLEERFKNKKIVLIGFGREGISTYRLLKKLSISYELYVMDQNPAIVEEYLEKAKDQTTYVL